jgi:hypothetical protein
MDKKPHQVKTDRQFNDGSKLEEAQDESDIDDYDPKMENPDHESLKEAQDETEIVGYEPEMENPDHEPVIENPLSTQEPELVKIQAKVPVEKIPETATPSAVVEEIPLSIINLPPNAFGETISNAPPPGYKLNGLADMEGVFVSQYQHRQLVDENGVLTDPEMARKAGKWAQEGLSIRCYRTGSCTVWGKKLQPYIDDGYIRLPNSSLRIKLGFDLSTDDSMKDYLEFVSVDNTFKLRWYRYTIGLNPMNPLPVELKKKLCSQLSNEVLNMWGLRGGKHIKSVTDG